MHVCLCHDFNDRKVIAVIKAHPEAERAKEIHKICADVPVPQCGQCLMTISDIRKAQKTAPCAK